MSRFTPVNIGSEANDSTGDKIRTAFQKLNADLAIADADLSTAETGIQAATILAQDATNAANAAEPAVNKSNDPDLTDNSAVKFPTQQAVRAYVLANAGGGMPPAIVADGTDTLTIDMAVWNTYIITLTENMLLQTTNVAAGRRATVILISNGVFDLTYEGGWRYITGIQPTTTFSGMVFKWELTAFGNSADKIIAEVGEHTEEN